jgi:hypothetical protein
MRKYFNLFNNLGGVIRVKKVIDLRGNIKENNLIYLREDIS